MKELPKVFANPIDKRINNNKTYSYGKLEDRSPERNEKYVMDKINKIFKNESTVYSIDCVVTFENNEEKYRIIGKTDHNLVTINQKLIPIRDIYDIDLA